MHVYLPIAQISLSVFLPVLLGMAVGVLTGMFGVGGGFLMTPALILIGVPPSVTVGSQAAQFVGASVSGVLSHWRRGNVDVKMGLVLLAGGVAGSFGGVHLFAWLRATGQIDAVISLLYVVLLGTVGGMMFAESLQALLRVSKEGAASAPPSRESWTRHLPFRMTFSRSRLVISPILPFVVGAFVGVLSALMGVGGGFIMVPAMIYLLRMPTKVVVGTSLFQIIFVSANTAFFQSVENHNVDVILAMLLLTGGVVGAPVGTWIGAKLRAEQLRILLAVVVLAVGAKMLFDVAIEPAELYSIAGK